MTTKILDRIMEGAKTPEGKFIAVLLVVCLAFMCWNVGTLNAFGDAYDNAAAFGTDAQKSAEQQEAAQPAAEAPAQPAAEPAAPEPEVAPEPEPVAVETPVVETPTAQTEATSDAGSEASQAADQNAAQDDKAKEEKADEENADEESDMPAQTFRKVANGVDVRVNAPEGAFPNGTEMVVTPIASTQVEEAVNGAIDGEASKIIAVDITFKFNGASIEPAKEISVSMTAVEIAEAQQTEVVHVDDSGSAQLVNQQAAAASDEVAFTSDKFSVYAIVVKDDQGQVVDQVVQYTYFFQTDEGKPYPFYNDAGQTVYSQIVKTGDVLQDVGTPAIPENAKFQGWYVYDEKTSTWGDKVEFGQPITTGDESKEIIVRPFLGNVGYVDFYEDAESGILLQRKQVVLTAGEGTFDVSSVKAPDDTQKGLAFVGWSKDANSQELVTEDVDDGNSATTMVKLTAAEGGTTELALYPVYKSAHWVNFFSAPVGSGATYIPPAYVTVDQETTAGARPATNPQWAGYEFKYWTKTPTFTETGTVEDGSPTYEMVQFSEPPAQYDFNEKVGNEDINLYAYWAPANANYTVVIWHQNVNDDKTWGDDQKTYEFYAQVNKSGLVGSTVTAGEAAQTYTGFTLNRNKSDKSVTVDANGDSIINLYYDRNLITMVFKYTGASNNWYYEVAKSDSGTQYGYVNGQYVELKAQTSSSISWYYYGSGWNYFTAYQYDGERYTREWKSSGRNKGSYVYTVTTKTDGELYGKTGSDSYSRIYKDEESEAAWYYDDVEYTGTRYTRSQVAGDVYTGLYGSTLADQGLQWPGGIWSYDNTGMSYLGEFVLPNENAQTIVFTKGSSSNQSTIEFFLQKPDGTYSDNQADDAGTVSGGGTFYFSEKYDGYTVAEYRRYTVSGSERTYYNSAGNAVSNPDQAWAKAAVDGTASLSGGSSKSGYNLQIRYKRLNYNLKFVDSANGSVLNSESVIYGGSLADKYPTADPVSSVPGKTFKGMWYSDATCTRPVFFSEPTEEQKANLKKTVQGPAGVAYEVPMTSADYDVITDMPRHDLTIYAGWDNVWYWVKIDPNGGVLTDTESTWFWETYGDTVEEYSDVTRKYVADPEGTYYYHYDEFNSADPDGAQASTRKAYYTDSSVLGSNGTTYSYDEDAYALVGWFKVNADGSLSAYNFGSGITENLTLRAVWRQVGEYRVVYHLEGVDETGAPLTDSNGQAIVAHGTVPQDNNSYADASDAAMMSAAGLEAPSGYVFWGWHYGDAVYNPGDAVSLDAGKYAQDNAFHVYPVFLKFEDVPVSTTQIVYDGNGGTTSLESTGLDEQTLMSTVVSADGTRITDGSLHANQSYTLRGEGTFTREGYTLVGWETYDGKYRFALGQEDVAVDNNDTATNPNANTLRAVWERDSYTVTVAKAVSNGTEALAGNSFTFSPSVRTEGNQNFDPRSNFALKAGEQVSFESVPYGSQFRVVEDVNGANFTTQVAATSGNATVAPVGAEGADATTYTITGNTTITFTNTYDSYRTTYNANAGDDVVNGMPADGTEYLPQSEATVPATTPMRDGYTFLDWNTAADGSGTTYKPGDTLTVNDNVTLYAQWVKNDKLTYQPNGGTGDPVEATGTVGATLQVAGNPFTRAGYTFAGWNTAADGTGTAYEVGANYTLADETEDVLYAQWTANENTPYKIQYYLQDLDDANYIVQADVVAKTGTTDATVSVADADIKSFEGFTYDPNNTNNELSGTVAADGTLVLKLYYDRNSYDVTYAYTNEVPGASALPQTASYKYGQTVTLADDATAEGYEFSGWTTQDVTPSNRTFTMPANAVAFTGGFTANENTAYKVQHYQQNAEGDGYTLYETESLTAETGTTVNATPKEYAGFAQASNHSDAVTSGTVTGDGKLVLKLYYDRDTFTVTYTDGVDGEEVFADAATAGVRYGAATPQFNSGKVPQRTGYEFASWNPAVDATVTADATYAATWTANTNTAYKVEHYQKNLNNDGYTLADTDNLTGTTATEVTATPKQYVGFTLNENAEGTVASGTIAADGSLVLKLYYDRNSYTVAYQYSGDTPAGAATLPVDSASYLYGQSVTVSAADPAPAGYSFSGWSVTSPEGVAVDGNTFAMPANNVVLSGSFSANTDTAYKVEHYKQNANDNGYALAKTETLTGTTGTGVTAVPIDYAADGYTHVNIAGSSVETGTIAGDGGLVLKVYYNLGTAQVTYAYDGTVPEGASAAPAAASYKFGQTVNVAVQPTVPAGYKFSGWKATGVEGASFAMPRSNVSFVGSFVANTNTAYTVERYLQNPDGSYPDKPTFTDANTVGTTGATASIKGTEVSYEGYTFDEDNTSNVLEGTISGDPENPLVLKAYYKANEYTVTYAYAANSPASATTLPAAVTYRTGATVTVAADAAAAGYDFQGWKRSVDGAEAALAAGSTFTMPAADVTITGAFVARADTPYEVQYYLQNINDDNYTRDDTMTKQLTGTTGSVVSVGSIEGGLPALTGFTHAAIEGKSVESGTVSANEKLVLKVYYNRDLYNVTYAYTGSVPTSANPADLAALGQTGVKYGARVDVAEAATAAGYTFSGWKAAGVASEGGSFAMPAANVQFAGSFAPRTNTAYTVERYYQLDNGAYAATATETVRGTGTTGAAVSMLAGEETAPASGKDGYVYDADNIGNVLSGTIAGDGSTVLRAYFKKQFSVTYLPGSHGTFAAATAGGLDYGAATPAAPETTGAAGYSFAGWSPARESTVTKNASYTAQWSANANTTYNVVYHYQVDGAYSDENAVTIPFQGETDTMARVVDEGATPTTARAGYVFDDSQNNVLSGNIAGDGSLTLHVYFKQQFSVTYKPGTHGTFTETTTTGLNYGAPTPAAPENATTGQAGYHFTGWNAAEGTTAGTATADVVYEAQWAPNSYTMTFDANGGTGAMDPQQFTYDTEQKINKNTFTREGYAFDGWTDDAGNVYTDEQVVKNLVSANNGTVALHARWVADWTGFDAKGFRVVYDGQPHFIAVNGTLSSDTVTYTAATAATAGEGLGTQAAAEPQTVANSFVDATAADNAVDVTVTRGDFTKTIRVNAIVSPIPITLTSPSATKAYDGTALTAADVAIEGTFAQGENITFTVVGSQTLVGSSPNAFTYELSNAKAGNYDIKQVSGTLTVTDANVGGDPEGTFDTSQVISKKHVPGTFGLGDTVNYTIKVTNIYDEAKTVTVTERGGVTIAGDATFELEAGELREIAATHVISEEDIAAGTFANTATVEFTGGTIPTSGPFTSNEDVVTPDEPEKALAVAKVIENAKDEYSVGDTVQYLITVTNTGNQTAQNVVVEDQLNGAAGTVEFTSLPEGAAVNGNTVALGDIAPASAGAEPQPVEIRATYTVQPEDNDATITNVALASADNVSADPANESDAVVAEVEGLYKLTVLYTFEGGAKAAEPYELTFHPGDVVPAVVSPEVPGFAPDKGEIAMPETMPARDMTFMVVYKTAADVARDGTDGLPEVIETIAGGGAAEVAANAAPGTPAATLAAAANAGTPAAAVNPAAVTVAATAPVAAAAAGEGPAAQVVIDDEGNPLVQSLADEDNPLASGVARGAWSLLDLIATLLTAAISIVLLVGLFGKSRKDEDDGDDDDPQIAYAGAGEAATATAGAGETAADGVAYAADEPEEDEPTQVKRHRTLRLMSLVPAIFAIVLLLFTQDFTQQMALFDRWTIVFAIVLIAQLVVAFLARKKETDDDSDDEAQQPDPALAPA